MKPKFYYSLLTILAVLSFAAHASYPGNGQGSRTGGEKKTSFTQNRQWEQRLSDKQRSGGEVRMISPIMGTNYQSDQIVFEWENGKSGNMFLGLLSNENKEVFYKEVSGNKKLIETKDIGLKPGLYYWVLESEDDILAVGKFYYKKK